MPVDYSGIVSKLKMPKLSVEVELSIDVERCGNGILLYHS